MDYREFPGIVDVVDGLRAAHRALAAEAIEAMDYFSPSPERYIMDPTDVRLFILPARWQGKLIGDAFADGYKGWRPGHHPLTLQQRTRLLAELTDHPLVVSAMYSCSMPGCEIVPHIDREESIGQVLRLHIGLHCPDDGCALVIGDQARQWRNGDALLFDSARIEHSAFNRSTMPRLIAIVDVARQDSLLA